MIFTVDDEVPSDNDKQLGNNVIVILNVSLSSCIISLMISILNDDDVDPAEMVTLNTIVQRTWHNLLQVNNVYNIMSLH